MRTTIPPTLSTASYNVNNQQTTFGTNSLTYDLNGNLQTVTDASGTATYAWNARNQLAAITAPGFAASFQYDSFGRRTGRTVQGVVTNYVHDGLNPVQEKSGSTVTANLLTGLGIDEFLMRTDGVGARALLPDALGSTVALGDNTGTLQTQYTYEPFGETSATGAASTSSYKYTGREDDGTGLYYYRARYYHPRLQRFIREDPLGFAGGDVNIYGYVRNNPIRRIDSAGLKPGDSFDCENDALKNAFQYACKSGTDVEHGGYIYVMPNGQYSYTFASGPPTTDTPGILGHVNPPTPPHSTRGRAVSVFHSHRSRGKFDQDRSDIDQGMQNYLFLPECKGIVRWDFDLDTEMPVNIR